MAVNMPVFLVITLITCLQTGQSMAVRIEVNQDRSNNITNDDIRISCTPDHNENQIVKEIMLMEIVKKGNKPIVVIRPGRKVSYPNGQHPRIESEGYIGKPLSQSFLNLTLRNPQGEDSGVYTCVMYFLTDDGFVKESRASSNVTEDSFDLLTREKMLLQKLSVLENAIKELIEKDTAILNNMTDFKTETKQRMQDLEDKAGYTVAFSVTNKFKDVSTTNGEVLIFPDLIMQIGQSYNLTSGIFMAPRDGLYAFYLVALENKSCALDLDLMANNKPLVKLLVFDDKYYTQTSVSAIAKLKSGDRVFTISRDDNCRLYRIQYSVFTGYLVQAL